MISKRYLYIIALLLAAFTGCKAGDGDDALPEPPTSGGANASLAIATDKAVYAPGEQIKFTLSQSPSAAQVRYKHLGEVVDGGALSGTSWTWTAPASDFTGYMAEVYTTTEGTEKVLATIGVDISSNWTKFPRYGFLSKYGQLSEQEVTQVMDNLNRHHINGIQFYDWHYKHHQPLAGTAATPQSVWKDIMNRDIYLPTVQQYIAAAHKHNMKAMFYNLAFGALKDAAADGVSEEWYLYKDRAHTTKDKHPLPQPPFVSDIYLTNPANTGWQQYLAKENSKVYNALGFDGYHIDQLGDRGTLYIYNGQSIDLGATYKPFIEAMQAAHPGKYHVMNAVNQYGQQSIAAAPVDFLYTEVWDPNSAFADLARIIQDNNSLGNNSKNTVLAAYMNYDLANNKGYFNTPSVLLADAVIFAFGGDHLELGEHMLDKEYFPNDNLAMKEDLRKALVSYYDFMVAYQNLLRDGGTFNNPTLSSIGQVKLNNWPPQRGQVSVVGKEVGNRQIIHLVNFTNASTLEWRDNSGTQVYPNDIKNVQLSLSSARTVKKMWYASPDFESGASRQIAFTQSGSQVNFTLPLLKYWDMVVVEY